MATQRTIRQAWTQIGPWHAAPGHWAVPAGGRERHCVTIEVYEADYFGKGPKLYACGSPLFQTDYDRSPRRVPGGWDDGHPDRIAARMAAVGAVLPEVRA